MKLLRDATHNRWGWACLFAGRAPSVKWNDEGHGLMLTVTGVVSEDERSTYKYRLVLEPEDVTSVLGFLGDQAGSSQGRMVGVLSEATYKQLRSLIGPNEDA